MFHKLHRYRPVITVYIFNSTYTTNKLSKNTQTVARTVQCTDDPKWRQTYFTTLSCHQLKSNRLLQKQWTVA